MRSLITPDLVRIVDAFENKDGCLDYMAKLLASSGCLSFPDRYVSAVKGREEIMSTGIGRGIAIPHARDLTVNCMKIAVCRINTPLNYQSVDDQPVSLVFMIAVPQNSNKEYMLILRNLSEYLRQEENRAKLLGANSDMELYQYVKDMEDIIIASTAD